MFKEYGEKKKNDAKKKMKNQNLNKSFNLDEMRKEKMYKTIEKINKNINKHNC